MLISFNLNANFHFKIPSGDKLQTAINQIAICLQNMIV
jgi:hypothetical protein